MQHFPIFLDTRDSRVLLAGGGEAALAKLRLLLKTEARIDVYAAAPAPEIRDWASHGLLTLHLHPLTQSDAKGARLAYAATEDDVEDARVAAIATAEGVLVNIVDNLADSAFITPAIVDRDPVTVAIGTEGAAPVLARTIKAELEETLPPSLGTLARIGKAFRGQVETLPMGRKRRNFWADYYAEGEDALHRDGSAGVVALLGRLLRRYKDADQTEGRIDLIGTGPGDAELLTLKARKAIDSADIIAHDGDIPTEILELARREARFIDLTTTPVDLLALAAGGRHVARLKPGAGTPDALIAAAGKAGIAWRIIPGLTLPAATSTPLPLEHAL